MNGLAKASLIGAAGIALLALGAALFIGSGAYNIGADDHHTKIVRAIIEQLRERSITVRADAIEVPPLGRAERIRAGAERYATLCIGCHLAPAVMKSPIRAGLYPQPPNLAQEDTRDARRTFWTIKHGIKMSGMPAWGTALDDAAIWDVVAFVRQLPEITPETYRQLAKGRPG